MPCNSDYMEASNWEREASKVMCVIHDLNGDQIEKSWLRGYHPLVYNRGISKDKIDKLTQEACSRLSSAKDTTIYTLETQVWWRDHQAADKARVAREKKEQSKRTIIKKALTKLTEEEKEALGIK